MKLCHVCKEEKPLSRFKKTKTNQIRSGATCYDCLNKKRREEYLLNREYWLEYEKERHIRDPLLTIKRLKQKKDYHRKHPERQMYNSAKARAVKKDIDFNITQQDILNVFPIDNKCPILGVTLIINGTVFNPLSPSLDRIDNTKGYIKGNIAVISHRANILKRNASIDELTKIINWMKLMLLKEDNGNP